MKQIIHEFKKYFCLTLGICLITSSVPSFSQETDFLEPILLRDIKEYNLAFGKQLEDLTLFINGIGMRDTLIDELIEKYNALIKEEDKILSRTKLVNLYYREPLEIIAFNKYIDLGGLEALETMRLQDRILLNKIKTSFYFVENKYPKVVFEPAYGILGKERSEEFKNCIKYFEKRFGEDKIYEALKNDFAAYNRGLYPKMTEFFIKTGVDPVEVLRIAYKELDMFPKEKAGIKLVVDAMDSDILVPKLVEKIRSYLTNFGKGIRDVKWYPPESIAKELEAMSIAKRTQYTYEITELKPGSKNFIKDVKKLDVPGKRYVIKNITQGLWPLAIVGAIATAAYITTLSAENHYNNTTKSQRELAEIGKKIENGTATKAEKYVFFTNPISKQFVETDPVYTLNFVKLAYDVYQADKLLNEIKSEEAQRQQQDVENEFMNNYQKTSDILAKDLQIGTL